ncbi:MAG: hypothetical protein ACOYI8_05905 [Christensenellales bacterium]
MSAFIIWHIAGGTGVFWGAVENETFIAYRNTAFDVASIGFDTTGL